MGQKNFAPKVEAVDLFCGVGGLTNGLIKSGIEVIAGIDIDESCKPTYEFNNKCDFITADIKKVKGDFISNLYSKYSIKILAGCAPCQPFSNHTNKNNHKKSSDDRLHLLEEFARLIVESMPDIVTMENVPAIAEPKYKPIFDVFLNSLSKIGLNHTWYKVVSVYRYGVPQTRKRLVLLASRFGDISLPEQSHQGRLPTVRDFIQHLPQIKAGEISSNDSLHYSSALTDINLKRIQSSRPGGNWADWDEQLLLPCHKKKSGKTYVSVYGRMEWDKPGPTITTQFYNLGTGRFGHPEQDRALSIREGALLQTFPLDYVFDYIPREKSIRTVAKHIGNAVPVNLAKSIGQGIIDHLKQTKHGTDKNI